MIAAIDPLEAAPSNPPGADQIVLKLQLSVSATRLSLYLGCRLRFFFRYVAGLKKPKTPALHVGSTVHRVLKVWGSRTKIGPADSIPGSHRVENVALRLESRFTTAFLQEDVAFVFRSSL